MNASSEVGKLRQLSCLYGIQTSYYDVNHKRQYASAETLLGILEAMGAPVNASGDVTVALRERRQAIWCQLVEPVYVAWDGETPIVKVRLPSDMADKHIAGNLIMETGEQQSWKWDAAILPISSIAEIEGKQYVIKDITFPVTLPLGYHQFTIETPVGYAKALIIAAPLKAYSFPQELENRVWGVFLPLYALYTRQSWGAGAYADLRTLIQWVSEMGGSVVSTLPLLSTFLGQTFEPSPYAPVSRLMWNEFYINIDSSPELEKCRSAQAIRSLSSFRKKLSVLQGSALVDYKDQMVLKRQILEELCGCCFTEASDRFTSLQKFIEANPLVEDYARFRATQEHLQLPWKSWPQRLREGILNEGDYNEDIKRYYLYAQWLAHQQVCELSGEAQNRGTGLYMDFPLGAHAEGYDVWREQNIFVTKVSGGAPPDAVFTKGQDWKFPPIHPERLRQHGYSYYIACIRHHLRHADILRIDHVMGLHRLFWIPEGMDASYGTYARYRPEEFYAILTLESQRNKTVIVGEDLGIVPPYVRPTMNRHGLHRTYVMQYELLNDSQKIPKQVPANVVAGIDTHDMPPFASFWQGQDIEERLELGFIDKTSAMIEKKGREALKEFMISFFKSKGWLQDSSSQEAVLRACLSFLGSSDAGVVLVNLEDLWLERKTQNIPASGEERHNWQRKARFALETFSDMPEVKESLKELNQLRKYRN